MLLHLKARGQRARRDRSIAAPINGLASRLSLIELVIVVVILAVIAAIAAPRMSNAADRARENSLAQTVVGLQKALDLYAIEHSDRCAAMDAAGTLDTDATRFVNRLLMKTDTQGNTGTLLGPYLSQWPQNPVNRRSSVRIDGPLAGAGTHGWRFDSVTGLIQPDHQSLLAQGSGGQGVSATQVQVQSQSASPSPGND